MSADPSPTIRKTCETCKTSWTAPVDACPECEPTSLKDPFSKNPAYRTSPPDLEAQAAAALATPEKAPANVSGAALICIDCAGTGTITGRAILKIEVCDTCHGTGCQHATSVKRDGHCQICQQDDACLRCKKDAAERPGNRDEEIMARQAKVYEDRASERLAEQEAIQQSVAKELGDSLDYWDDSTAFIDQVMAEIEPIVPHAVQQGIIRKHLESVWAKGLASAPERPVEMPREILVDIPGTYPLGGGRFWHAEKASAHATPGLPPTTIYTVKDEGETPLVGVTHPHKAWVKIKGLPGEVPPTQPWLEGLWEATLLPGTNEPIYQIDSDPNAVAVGRFKASLRKFLGVS